MQRRDYLYTTGSAAIGLGLAGCLGSDEDSPDDEGPNGNDDPESETDETDGESGGNETGLLSTAVSDDPADIGDFESLVVTIEQIRVFPKGEDDGHEEEDDHDDHDHEDDSGSTEENPEEEEQESEEDGAPSHEGEEEETGESDGDSGAGRITIPVDDAKADLVDLQGDAKSIIDETELDVGTYSHLQLVVSDEVNATLKDGGEASVMTPGNAPLQFNAEFDIRADTATQFVADFAPHRRGPPESTEYMLRPVPSEIEVSYEPLGESEPEEDESEDSEDDTGSDETTDDSEQTDEGAQDDTSQDGGDTTEE